MASLCQSCFCTGGSNRSVNHFRMPFGWYHLLCSQYFSTHRAVLSFGQSCFCAGGSNRISKVHSSVNIISSIEGDGTHGGLVGAVSSGTTTIEDCLFDGSITGELTSHCAGLVGWSGAMSYIYNSLMIGEITTSEENSCVLSRNPVNARVYNCYYTQPYGSINDGAIQLDDNQLINGEACWLLNGSKVADNWHQTLPADEAPTLHSHMLQRKRLGI